MLEMVFDLHSIIAYVRKKFGTHLDIIDKVWLKNLIGGNSELNWYSANLRFLLGSFDFKVKFPTKLAFSK